MLMAWAWVKRNWQDAVMNTLLALGVALAMSAVVLSVVGSIGCAKGQFQVGRDPATHPSRATLRRHLCAGNDEAARLYLHDPAFQWLGPVLEDYLTEAQEHRRLGRCECEGRTCEERAAARERGSR